MPADTTQRLSLGGEHGNLAKIRGNLGVGLAGPAQGSADVLQMGATPVETNLLNSGRGISVTPPEVVFEDVRAGLLFVLTFSVQNTTGATRRLQVIPPRTPAFSLNYEPVGGIAPGLDVHAEVEFQLPDEDEVGDLGSAFAPGEVREYVDKFIIISGKDKVEVPLLARRPTPAVIHNRAVEFGTVCDEKKAFGTVSLVNKGSRKANFSIIWDKGLPLAFNPSEVMFDATRWSTTEPFRALAKLVVPGQEDSVIDLSAVVCKQKLKLLDGSESSSSELSSADFGTLYYGCQGEIESVLFNDGPEAAPFIVTVKVEGGHQGGGAEGHSRTPKLPFEVEPRDGTVPPYGRQKVAVRFAPNLPPRVSGFKGEGCEQEPLPSAFKGRLLYENAEKKGDTVSLSLLGRGVLPTVNVTRRVVRFGSCSCFDRRDVVVGISNTGELPIRFSISKAPNFACTPSKGLLQPMQSQNTVLTFCPTQLGHFRGVLKLSLGDDTLIVPIRVVGEASTVGAKQPRPGGIDKLPADFKPRFKFVLSESASGIRRAAEGKEAWLRPKPFQTVNVLATNSWDCSTHTVGSVGGVDEAFNKLTFSLQDLARREQSRRDWDAWLTVQRLKRSRAAADRENVRMAKAQGKDWRDPEGGVEMGMGRREKGGRGEEDSRHPAHDFVAQWRNSWN